MIEKAELSGSGTWERVDPWTVDYRRMRRFFLVSIAALFVAVPGVASAQRSTGSGGRTGGSGSTADTIPKASMPPAGMCRVWINGVKPEQQPAPVDCAAAVRNVPPNGRVIWGDTAGKAKPAAKPPGTVVPPPGTVPPPGVKTNPIKILPRPRNRDTTQSRSA